MPLVGKAGNPSLASLNGPQANFDPQRTAPGASVGLFDACKITAAGVVRSVGADPVHGFAGDITEEVGGDEPVTLILNERVRYGAGLVPGTLLYLSADTPGRLDTTPNGAPVARVTAPDTIYLIGRVAP